MLARFVFSSGGRLIRNSLEKSSHRGDACCWKVERQSFMVSALLSGDIGGEP